MGLNDTKKLTYDVPTRWNSAYVMLRDLLFYKDAFQHLASVDPNYINLPSHDEWSYATTLCQFLINVTANVVFEEIQKVCNHLRTYSVADNDYIRSKLGYLKYVLESLNEVDAMVQYEKVESSLHELYIEYKNVYDTNYEENENANNAIVEFEEERALAFSREAFFTCYLSSVSAQVPHIDLEAYLNDPIE
ncbi:putative AC transposase [Nymphaea thermarum]|nr:putative AC transposase [Nymphaea thermarum]